METRPAKKGITKAELELLGVARIFHRFTHEERADMMSSHRLGYWSAPIPPA